MGDARLVQPARCREQHDLLDELESALVASVASGSAPRSGDVGMLQRGAHRQARAGARDICHRRVEVLIEGPGARVRVQRHVCPKRLAGQAHALIVRPECLFEGELPALAPPRHARARSRMAMPAVGCLGVAAVQTENPHRRDDRELFRAFRSVGCRIAPLGARVRERRWLLDRLRAGAGRRLLRRRRRMLRFGTRPCPTTRRPEPRHQNQRSPSHAHHGDEHATATGTRLSGEVRTAKF